MPFGAHWYDLLPVLIIALLFLGPKRLPQMGSSVGQTIREFQKSMREVKGAPAEETQTPALPAATVKATEPAE